MYLLNLYVNCSNKAFSWTESIVSVLRMCKYFKYWCYRTRTSFIIGKKRWLGLKEAIPYKYWKISTDTFIIFSFFLHWKIKWNNFIRNEKLIANSFLSMLLLVILPATMFLNHFCGFLFIDRENQIYNMITIAGYHPSVK